MTKQTRTKVPSNVDRVTCNGEVKYQRVMTDEQIDQLKKTLDDAPNDKCYLENGYYFSFIGSQYCVWDIDRKGWYSAIFSGLNGSLVSDIDTIIEQHEQIAAKDARIAELELTCNLLLLACKDIGVHTTIETDTAYNSAIKLLGSALDKGDS